MSTSDVCGKHTHGTQTEYMQNIHTHKVSQSKVNETHIVDCTYFQEHVLFVFCNGMSSAH